jgi:Fe-S cluster biogenesis protein NfuA/nitrite reductase/ring-hydroxylating ferredoxin subunit
MNAPALSGPETGPNGHNGHNGSNGHADPVEDMNRQGRRIQELIEKIDSLPEPSARALVHECMASLLGFYGQGLERVLQTLKRAGIGGQTAYDELIHDRVFSGLLLIHGLHPIDLETRLRDALEKIRPYMQSHGGNVELLSLQGEFARLRLHGACKTCPSSSVTMELAVRHAIEEACPDLAGFEVEGAAAPAEPQDAGAEWTAIEEAHYLKEGGLIRVSALGANLILCKASGNLYAYRDRCPACNLPLHLGALEAGILACRAGHRFSVRDAGVGADDPHLHLEPVPLILDRGSVQVALAAENQTDECAAH